MRANQKLIADDGYEVCLFPMEYLYMTQDEGGNYSHYGTYNIDLAGWGNVGVVYRCPLYAPCTMHVISTSLSYYGGNAVIFESNNMVHLANGSLDYVTIMFMHDNNPPYRRVGQTVQQGQLCYRTGTFGMVTGDHVHTCIGKGRGGYFVQRPSGNWDLSNRIHYWNGVYVNDTTIVRGFGHPWTKWTGGTTPPSPSPMVYNKDKYNFVLFNRRKRQEQWTRKPLKKKYKN